MIRLAAVACVVGCAGKPADAEGTVDDGADTDPGSDSDTDTDTDADTDVDTGPRDDPAGTTFGVAGRDLDLGDLDGDGDVDVVTVDVNFSALYYENLGGGALVAGAAADALSYRGWNALALADLNGDGHPDLAAAASYPPLLAWSANDGSGVFAPVAPIPSGVDPAAVVAADLDADGDVDLVAGGSGSELPGGLAWFENDGAGGFSSEHPIDGPVDGPLVVADLDVDGAMDVLAFQYTPPSYFCVGGTHLPVWYPGLPGGGVGAPRALYGAMCDDVALDVADFDGDGDLDIVAAAGSDVALFVQTSPATFGLPVPVPPVPNTLVEALLASDLDADGDPDLATVVYGFGSGQLVVYENLGASFAEARVIAEDPVGGSLAAADIDGDGAIDLVTAAAWYRP